jgi:hypothetical protein
LREADAYARLVDLGRSQRDLAPRVGRSQSHISKRLQLRRLPGEAREALEAGRITVDTALDIVQLVKAGFADRAVELLASAKDPAAVAVVVARELDRAKREEALRKEMLAAGLDELSADDIAKWTSPELEDGPELERYGSDFPKNRVGATAFRILDAPAGPTVVLYGPPREVEDPPPAPDAAPPAAEETAPTAPAPTVERDVDGDRWNALVALVGRERPVSPPSGGYSPADRWAAAGLLLDVIDTGHDQDLTALFQVDALVDVVELVMVAPRWLTFAVSMLRAHESIRHRPPGTDGLVRELIAGLVTVGYVPTDGELELVKDPSEGVGGDTTSCVGSPGEATDLAGDPGGELAADSAGPDVVEPAPDMAEDGAGPGPSSLPDVPELELRWAAFSDANLPDESTANRAWADRERALFVEALVERLPDAELALDQLVEVHAAFRRELDEYGPADVKKNGPDDLHRFDRFRERLVEILEVDGSLPPLLRTAVLERDEISFNDRPGPKSRPFPRLLLVDLTDELAVHVSLDGEWEPSEKCPHCDHRAAIHSGPGAPRPGRCHEAGGLVAPCDCPGWHPLLDAPDPADLPLPRYEDLTVEEVLAELDMPGTADGVVRAVLSWETAHGGRPAITGHCQFLLDETQEVGA